MMRSEIPRQAHHHPPPPNLAMTSLKSYQMLIDGQWTAAADGGEFPSVNPATGQPWALIPKPPKPMWITPCKPPTAPIHLGHGGAPRPPSAAKRCVNWPIYWRCNPRSWGGWRAWTAANSSPKRAGKRNISPIFSTITPVAPTKFTAKPCPSISRIYSSSRSAKPWAWWPPWCRGIRSYFWPRSNSGRRWRPAIRWC